MLQNDEGAFPRLVLASTAVPTLTGPERTLDQRDQAPKPLDGWR